MVHRVLDAFDKLALDLLEATNVLPTDVGNLDHRNLAESGRVRHAEREAEVLHGDTERIEDFRVDGVLVEIDQVHLLADLLHGSLRAERRNVGADIAVGLGGNGLQVDVLAQLHVLGVDLQNLQTAGRVGDADVDFTVETAVSAKGRVNGVGAVGGSHDHHVGASLHAVHQGEKLGDDTALDFSVGLLTLGSDGINLVDEDDGRRVLLRLLECLAQIGLGFTGHLGHDLGAVDQEEESTGLIGHGASHQSLTSTGRAVQEDTTRWLDTDGLEELRMTKGQLDELTDLGHLLPAATDIIVTHLVEVPLFILALDRLALAVNDGVLSNDAVLRRIDLDDLELHLSHTAAYCEEITLSHRPIGFTEVRSEVDVEQRASQAFDGVCDGEHSNAFGLRTG